MVNKLKSLFAKDIDRADYLASDKSETFKRPSDTSIVDFIHEFERLYNNIKKHEMELPKKLSDLKIVKKGEISENGQHLARATLTLFSYECMLRQLKAI